MNEGIYFKRKWVVAPGREEKNNKRTKILDSRSGFFVLFLFLLFLPSSEVVFFTFHHQDIAIMANFGVQTKRPL